MLVESDNRIILENRSVSMAIQKSTGRIISLEHQGDSLLSPRQFGYFTILASYVEDSDTNYMAGKESSVRAKFLRDQNPEFNVHINNREMVDISFTPQTTRRFPVQDGTPLCLESG